eukprot:3257945-Pyramimonas_sp.AAC.1
MQRDGPTRLPRVPLAGSAVGPRRGWRQGAHPSNKVQILGQGSLVHASGAAPPSCSLGPQIRHGPKGASRWGPPPARAEQLA